MSPRFLDRPGHRIAYVHQPGNGPALLFLPGYMSDMSGGKAQALGAWATAQGRGFLSYDQMGCGLSSGDFAVQTLETMRDDALALIAACDPGPLVIVGSSMGGWLMLLLAEALGARVAGLVGIAAAPDFTDWGYTPAEQSRIMAEGVLHRPNPYGDHPTPTWQPFFASGQRNRLLERRIAVEAPVRLLHGQRDPDVPWEVSLRLAAALGSDDVQVRLVKDGDHRLSRPQDIALLVATVSELMADLDG